MTLQYSTYPVGYEWFRGIKGSARFVSFDDGVMTLKFTGVEMMNYNYHIYGDTGSDAPATLTLNGCIPFAFEAS